MKTTMMLPRFGTIGMTVNKIGIFGGTFNPVHTGHIAIAEEFIDIFALDRLYVIPNNIPPLKNNGNVSGEDRTEMLKIAFSGNNKIIISDMELKRQGTSYTCDTIAELKKIHPESELYLLTGDDWINSFDKWKNYEFILNNASLVIANRSGQDIASGLNKLQSLTGKRPLLLGNEIIKLSSTDLRRNPNESDLPQGVYEYIKKRGLYGI